MANFNRSGITTNAINLIGKALKGETIQFTRLVMGDGEFTGEIVDLTGVVSIRQSVDITNVEHKGNICSVSGELATESVKEEFWWREIGLYALDPQEGEILYSYAYSDKPDCIVPDGSGVTEDIIIGMTTAVGENTKVEVLIDDSMVFSTKKEFNKLVEHTLGEINVREFGAKGDGIADDTDSIQNAVIHAWKNRMSVFIPGGIYKITRPILVVSNSNEVNGSFYIRGENIEHTQIKCVTTQLLSDVAPFNKKCCFMLINETCLNADNTLNTNGSKSTGRISITDMMLLSSDKSAEIGIYAPISTFSSTFKRMRIRQFTEAGIKNADHFFLNRIEQVRVDSSTIAFHIGNGGICTSNHLDGCYAVGSDTGYSIRGVYSQLTDCCADGIRGTVFDLTGFRGTVTTPGSESDKALCTFKGGQYTHATIVGAYTYGNFENEEAWHINAGAGAQMYFIGGRILVDDTVGNRIAPGGLLKTGTESNVTFTDVRTEKYVKQSDYKDFTINNEHKTRSGRVNTRHGGDIAYIGHDDGWKYPNGENMGYVDSMCTSPKISANAIFFGFDGSPQYKEDVNYAWHRPNAIGDIILSRRPKAIGGIGWIQASTEQTQWSQGEYLKIPVIHSGTTEERPTSDLRTGQMYFDTTLNKPIWYGKGQPDGRRWVDATGTQV